MNGFWSLVGFEYRKILRKKSVVITLLLAMILSMISCWGTLLGNYYIDGKLFESHYEGMVKDRTYARSLAGREIDAGLILEAAHAYAQIPEANLYQGTEEYQTLARKYNGIYSISRAIYNTASRRFNMEDFQVLTKKQADDFYTLRRDKQTQAVEQTRMSDRGKEAVLALDARVKTPFAFSYTDGYTRFFTLMYSEGLMAAFVMAICIAPLFSAEYATGADQLILASKHGKRRLIQAKLFTGFSLAAAITLTLTALSYFLSMLTFGFDGGNAPLQLYYPMSPYPLTMGQTALLLSICILFACLLTAAVTMLLSAKLKSPFGVIVLISLLLVVPMFIQVSYDPIWLSNLVHLLPTYMMDFGPVTSPIQYEMLGLVVRPYVFMPLFAAVVCILLAPLAYLAFKHHQIV